MSHPDFAVAGSGLASWHTTTRRSRDGRRVVSSWGFLDRRDVTVWQQGDVAWAQILGSVRTRRDGVESDVPYWNTGCSPARKTAILAWRYWGGAEPQEEPRV
jgi:hypothetical protein